MYVVTKEVRKSEQISGRELNARHKKSRSRGFYHQSDKLSEGAGQSSAGSEPSLYGFSNGKPHGIPILTMRIIAQALITTRTASTRILNLFSEWRNDITSPQSKAAYATLVCLAVGLEIYHDKNANSKHKPMTMNLSSA
ncbi:hypothetical protein DPD57_23325 [Salmonella enterica subsp. enterica serovar Kottbus]|nr:hypothetical protein [Salmonella enterica subsp. enterica serovar Kottbus]ECF6943220.1 hypothetical protein [Salmonella enterica subsp. enterica]ECI5144318.1 hypothetical protein [Salmonella enterica subsp. salamae]